jgi:glutamate 5-kinase
LTEGDFTSRARYLNLRNTMSRLLELGVLPVINENDTISTSEIEEGPDRGSRRNSGSAGGSTSNPARPPVFGDNDMLSALVASKLGSDLLLILSDVSGLYPVSPDEAASGRDLDASGRPLSVVPAITPEIEAMAGKGNSRGRGGMASKLEAVRIAVQSGVLAVIASGTQPGTIRRVLDGEDVGTLFLPRKRLSSRKLWIAFASPVAGKVKVNAGAREALLIKRSSLLFAGVLDVDGAFERGDVVSIVDEEGREFARGIVNYGSGEARPLLGKRSAEIAASAGRNYAELITRDNIAERE